MKFTIILNIIIIVLLAYLIYDLIKHKRAGYKMIKPEKFKELYSKADKGIEIIDLRDPADFKKERLFRSRNLYVYGYDFTNSIKSLDKRKTYYLYSHKTNLTKHACYQLTKHDIKNVTGIKGNFDKLKATGVQLKK